MPCIQHAAVGDCHVPATDFYCHFTGNAELAVYTEWAIRIYMAASPAVWHPNCLSANLYCPGQRADLCFSGAFKKGYFADTAYFSCCPPYFLIRYSAYSCAEPVADTIAVTVTSILFLREYRRLSHKNWYVLTYPVIFLIRIKLAPGIKKLPEPEVVYEPG